MKIAVIGSSGFLARKLIPRLHSLGHEISMFTARRQVNNGIPHFSSIKEGFDVVFYFPAIISGGEYKPFEEMFSVNTWNVFRLIEILKSWDSRTTLIFPSTRLVYEHSDLPQDENALCSPKSDYAKTKYLAESIIQKELSAINKIDFKILRIGVVHCGHSSDEENIGTLAQMRKSLKESGRIVIFGDGEQRRTFTHVDDVISVLSGVMNEKVPSGIYNVGGQSLSIVEVAKWLSKKLDGEVNFNEWPEYYLKYETGSTIFNSKKLDDFLGINYVDLI